MTDRKGTKGIMRKSKESHRHRLEGVFGAKNNKKVWDTMKKMTGLATSNKSIVMDNEVGFAKLIKFLFLLDLNQVIMNYLRL